MDIKAQDLRCPPRPCWPAAALILGIAALLTTGCASRSVGPDMFEPKPKASQDFANIGYAEWSDDEPPYRFYPGDEVEVQCPSAPELNRTAVVQPDGRISLPLVGAVMAADRSAQDLEAALTDAYGHHLLRPDVTVGVKTAGPLKIFVGGEVDKPGIYDMSGDMDALRAVFQAGGFKPSGKRTQVVIIRRGPDGRAMYRTTDLRAAMTGGAGADAVPLRRFDIVYVPRTGISTVGVFVQQYLRDALPVQIGFSYALNNNARY
jgi:polysaccharide export outer membrane protein